MGKELYIGGAIELIGNGAGAGLQMTGYINPSLGWTIIAVSTIAGLILIILGYKKKKGKSLQVQNTTGIDVKHEGLSIEIIKALVSGIETGEESRKTQLTYFIVNIKFTLRIANLPIHLAWVKLCIAGEEIPPFESLPPLKDEIKHSEESYECKYRVPRHIFLKGRYPDSTSIRRESDESRAYISIRDGGEDWKSEVFSILYKTQAIR